MQDVQDTAIAQRSPNDLTVSVATPEPRRALEVMISEMFDDGQGRWRLVEQIEDQADCLLDLFVGIENDPALKIVDQPCRRPEPKLAIGCLLQFAAQKAATNQVKFGLAHGSQESKEKPVGVLSGVINPVLVDNQCVGQGTDLDETIPITARSCQARGFQAQDGAGPAQANLSDEVLKSVATGRRRP
jgi:hypothetical protein